MARIVKSASSATVTRTGYTVKVETPDRIYLMGGTGFPRAGYGVASQLKADALSVREITETGDRWNGIPGGTPAAVRYHNIPLDTLLPTRAVCIDIRAAYPNTLANLGIIGPKAYSSLMRLPKPARLKATGMMGTTRYIEHFEAARLTGRDRIQEPTAGAFFAACEHVGRVMQYAANESAEKFLLFWVDGIFVRECAAPLVREILHGAGYETTSEPVDGIRRSASGRYVFYTKGGKQTYLCAPQRVTFDATELMQKLDAC